MLHYLNAGLRNYGESPVYPYARGVVEFQVICRGSARPEPCPLSVKAPCLWVFSPTFVHGWVDEPGKESEIRVFHFSRVDPMVQQLLSREDFLVCGLSGRELARVEEGYRRLADPVSAWRELVSDLVAAELSLLAVKDWPRERERSGNQVAERAVRQACS